MMFLNEDWVHFIWSRHSKGIDVTEDVLKEFIYSYKDTQVTDFMMNVNGTISTAPSQVFETFADKYLAKEEEGVAVDYTETYAKVAYDLICEQKIDMYEVWTKALKEIGINPWISIRVNDCHHNMYGKPDLVKSRYVEANPDAHIASYREKIGYFDKCLDYSLEKVRIRMLSYISEMLDRYDVYGLELDLMRDFIFTKPGYESDITLFLDGVRELLKQFEAKWGHKIKLMLLLPSEPNLCLERGVNVIDYADIIDYIAIIARWQTTDTDMPIELWKQLLRGTDIKIGCGQQLLFKPFSGYKTVFTSEKMAYGQAVANLSRGSDFVYLYNYMDLLTDDLTEDCYEQSIRDEKLLPQILKNIGDVNTLIKKERSHVVTYSDFNRYDMMVYSRLPISFGDSREFETVKIPVGKIAEGSTVRLVLGFMGSPSPESIKVYVNSLEAKFSDITNINELIYENNCYVFDICGNYADIMYAEISVAEKSMLEYVEIEVVPSKN